MSEYSPPLEDMKFALKQVVDVDSLSKLPDFSEVGLEALDALLDEASRFFNEVISPTNRTGDLEGSSLNDDGSVSTPTGFREAYAQYVEAGWGAISFDPEYGGGGFPWLVGIAVTEMLTAANMALSLNPMLTQGSIHALSAHGDQDQKLAWLPKLITGEWSGTMNLTEPQAGSDVGALTTKAERQENGTYKITGQKIYITWGEHDLTDNIIHLVLARTPDAPPGTKGISLFIVPKFLVNDDGSLGDENDIKCLSIEHKLGIHASPTCVLQFGDNGGALGYIVGEENSGMRSMFTMMNQARLAVGLEGLAVADRAYQQALDYAIERMQGRRTDTPKGESVPIIDHPDVRRMLMTMKAYIEAMRCLIYLNAKAIDIAHHHPDAEERERGNELTDLLTPLSKSWCTDLGNELTSLGIQIHGGMGFVEETGAAQHYRDIRIAGIYEGTNGIQAVDLVGRKLAMRNGDVVRELLTEISETATNLITADLEGIGNALEYAVKDMQEATEWLVEKGGASTDDGLAGATPYLRMFGTTVGGWLLAKSALQAKNLLDEGDDSEFLKAKIETALFYSEQLLPQVSGLLPSVISGARSLYAITPDKLRG
ncbi:MAG: acyl-CoA dehydrogenase [Acidimicrobiaceae bacterium]|jgi:alkylation response protein AidB-like acyl-CoA dehydrogenase|nr:acyl-CoA dehydrogenase [Acidimicrobiaceae bacterium]|tara:strand:- start:13792 stop:15585 length:1794 start_codon:yes stop_codon:yes gene_type:complete